MIPLISPLIVDSYLGFKHILSGCKRLKAQVSKCIIDEYKRLVEVMISENLFFMIIFRVEPIGEMRE